MPNADLVLRAGCDIYFLSQKTELFQYSFSEEAERFRYASKCEN